MRIVYLPLDERPCNYRFPAMMPNAGASLSLPPLSIMGRKKRPANLQAVASWLKQESKGADAAVIALDTLLYGGLIPSRLHGEREEALCARADLLRALRRENPALRLYAFQTIMRCPFYSLSDEEPDYYAECGAEIHLFGRYRHKETLGILTEAERADDERVRAKIPPQALADYTARRRVNLNVLLHTIELFREGIFDGFLVAQDDSAPYGFTSMDQREVRAVIGNYALQSEIPVYPAADDVGMTLLCRAVNERLGVKPKIFAGYASAKGPFVVPAFEDRSVDATIKNQIRAAGCVRVYSLPECDIFLAVNVGSEMPYGATEEQREVPYHIERNLPEYLDRIEYALAAGKKVAVADIAYPSSSDLELIRLLQKRGLLLKIHAYAGWNTSSNTLGTVICESCLYLAGGDERGNRDFLLHRYYDDVGYCSHSRTWIDEHAVPENGCTVFELDGERGKCVAAAKTELLRYMRENYPELAACVDDIDVSAPWNRTFEMDFILRTNENGLYENNQNK